MTVIVHYRRFFGDREDEFQSEDAARKFIKTGEDAGEFFAGHIIDAETREILWEGADPFRRPRWRRPEAGTVLPLLKVPA